MYYQLTVRRWMFLWVIPTGQIEKERERDSDLSSDQKNTGHFVRHLEKIQDILLDNGS